MAELSLFEKIVAGEISSFIIWQDEQHAAFLTPFANTPGATVVVPKVNIGDNAFHLTDEQLSNLMLAAKKVANLLEKALNVERVAMVFEGEAVPHVHAKLFPMHGVQEDRSHFPKQQVFMTQYPGYITTADGPKMDDSELQAIQAKIKAVHDEN
jgi:diadenosine tetraphosphate (Ap4A) HIT family hydrolase